MREKGLATTWRMFKQAEVQVEVETTTCSCLQRRDTPRTTPSGLKH